MPTPHINAEPGDFAATVLMPGDPLRAKYIAGSCGTTHPEVELRDIVIAMGASTDSGVNRMRFMGHDLAALASFDLVRHAVRTAEAKGLAYHVGNIFSADLFYTPQPELFELMAKYDILGVEMESAGLYPLAAEHRVQALAMCTVSDDIRTGDHLSSAERQTTFDDMILLALETAVAAAAD
jgi:purine-nucleoside phosphorylase